MQKLLLLTAASMTAMCVSAQTFGFERTMAEKSAVNHFLSTEIGKNFTEQQVREAMQLGNAMAGCRKAKANETVTLINETFDKWTAGSNDEPDATIVNADDQEAVDALCDQPGWTAFLCSQAGGAVYQSFDEVGDDGPGYLMTPNMDLTKNQGVFRFTARVKNVNPDATTANLQYFVVDNDPEHMSLKQANTMHMEYGEWTDVEFIAHTNTVYTGIMFYSWSGKVLIDEVKVEELIYALDTPSNIQVAAVNGNAIKVSCDPIEGATEYTFNAESRNGSNNATVTVSEPEAIIEGWFDANEDVIVRVVASNGTDTSYEGAGYGPLSYTGVIDTPVALEATNVTENGFTANWEPSLWANTYVLSLNRTHTVGEEPETIYYMQEDFSEVTLDINDPSSTLMTTDGNPVSLDPYMNAKGWNAYLVSLSTGMLALTNMYEAYGFPGMMFTGEKDFSYGGGKVRISGMGMSMVDDIVMKVGFAEKKITMMGYTYEFLDGAQEFEMSPDGSMFDVEIEGGTESSILLIKMVDASPTGDMAVFATLNISAEAAPGEQFSAPFATVVAPSDATSYNVEVAFPAGDTFTYSIVGKYGSNASAASEVITVEAPDPVKLDRMEVHEQISAIFTLDGRRVNANNLNELQNGTYIVRGQKVAK